MGRKKKINTEENFTFLQIPVFDKDEQFTITAQELTELFKCVELYSTFLPIFEKFVARMIDEQKISVKYIDLDGNELSKDEVTLRINKALKQIPLPPFTEPDL